MKIFRRLLIIFVLVVLTASCRTVKTNLANKDIYTKVNIRYDDNKKIAYFINYKKLTLLPANSKVQISKVTGRSFVLKLPSGETIEYIYKEGWGRKPIEKVLADLFSNSDISSTISRYSGVDKQGIDKGEAIKGMSKQAVIVALGSPAAHKTPSTKSDHWLYWDSKFDTFSVLFKNNKVKEIKD